MSVDFLREFVESSDWQHVQDLLKEATDASILWVVSSSGESIQKFDENYSEFCYLIRKTPEGLRKCQNSHYARFQEVKRTGIPVVSACYCGLIAFAIPIMMEGKIVCVAGGCHSQAEFPITMDKCAEISVACNIDIKDVMELAKKIKHIPKIEQRRFMSMLNVFAGMISPLIKWMNRPFITPDIKDNRDLLLMGEICSITSSDNDPKHKLDRITEAIRFQMAIDACSIYKLDDNTQELVLKSTNGLPESTIGQRIKVGEGIVGYSAEMRIPVAVEDVTKDSRAIRSPFKPGRKRRIYHSILTIPLTISEDLVGIMDARTFEPKIWKQNETDLLSMLAIHIARITQQLD